jgi:hypothetical protein
MTVSQTDEKYVYKYRNFSSNHLQAMYKNKIWYSISSQFNDPFDSSTHLIPQLTSTQCALDIFKTGAPELYQRIQNDVLRSGQHIEDVMTLDFETFFSETEENILSGLYPLLERSYIFSACNNWNNKSMWSHYGDYHKGFCVRYDVNKLLQSDEIVRAHRAVTYQANAITILDFLNFDRLSKSIEDVIFTKCLDYELEDEYRFILSEYRKTAKDYGGHFRAKSIPVEHHPNAVDAIYFGMKSSSFDKMQLKLLLSERDINYFDVNPKNDGSFDLDFSPTKFNAVE